jgi:hypothetical protein
MIVKGDKGVVIYPKQCECGGDSRGYSFCFRCARILTYNRIPFDSWEFVTDWPNQEPNKSEDTSFEFRWEKEPE